jgi:hypothetical protein
MQTWSFLSFACFEACQRAMQGLMKTRGEFSASKEQNTAMSMALRASN